MNINLYCPLGGTGYGIAGLNIYKALYKTPNKISLFAMNSIGQEYEDDISALNEGILNQQSFDPDAPCVKIWHQFDLANRIGRGKYFAFPFFEINEFNTREKHHLNSCDEIIVSSSWAKKIINDNDVNKTTHIVPLGVDRNIFNNEYFTNNSIEDKYIFITVGKWEKRKSHDIIIELFNKAFEPKDNVELWMITHNPFLNKELEQQWHDMVLGSKMRQHIKMFPRIKTQKELAHIMSYASCGIYPARAEGWNLDLLETMSLNKPVITTNYSAHTEFCNKNNSYLIDIDDLEDAYDGLWFNGFGQWAKIGESQKEQIVHYMRYVYEKNIRTNPDGVETAKKFSWENSAEKLLECIE